MSNLTDDPSFPQHSLIKSFLLHVTPGILVTLAFVLFYRVIKWTGNPPLLAFLLAILLIDLPFMVGVLLFEGKKLNGRYSLKGVVLYRQEIPAKTFIAVFIGAFVVVYLLILLSSPLSSYLRSGIFSNLPAWIFLDDQGQYQTYTKNILVAVFSIQLILTGIVLPWVEELYFRGYLMPRISRFGIWTPIIAGSFFGFYHVWQLYDFPAIFLLGVALGYVVWWTRDIHTSISLHIFANLISRAMILMAVLAM